MHLRVRNFESGDLPTILELERSFGTQPIVDGNQLQLSCDLFSRECWLLLRDETAAGFLLSFPRAKQSYCCAIKLAPDLEPNAARTLVEAYLRALVGHADRCWFGLDGNGITARVLTSVLAELGMRVQVAGDAARVAYFDTLELPTALDLAVRPRPRGGPTLAAGLLP